MKINLCKRSIAFLLLLLMSRSFSAIASNKDLSLKSEDFGPISWSVESVHEYFEYVDSRDKPKTLIIGSGRAGGYSEERYGFNKNLYFLVNIDQETSPDYCCNVEDIENLSLLGLGQWDIVVLEMLPIPLYLKGVAIDNVYKLLRKNGHITFLFGSELIEQYRYCCLEHFFLNNERLMCFERCPDAEKAFRLFETSFFEGITLSKEEKDKNIRLAFNFDINKPYDIELIPVNMIFGTLLYPRQFSGPEEYLKKYFIVVIEKL